MPIMLAAHRAGRVRAGTGAQSAMLMRMNDDSPNDALSYNPTQAMRQRQAFAIAIARSASTQMRRACRSAAESKREYNGRCSAAGRPGKSLSLPGQCRERATLAI